MLQSNKPTPAVESDLVAGDAAAQAELLAWLKSLVRRQLPVITSVALLTTTLGMLYVITTPSSYTAQATMIIDTHKVQLFQQQGLFSDPVIDTGLVDSQVEILKSENIAVAVLKKLHLTEDPEFTERGGFISALIESVSGLFGSSEPKSLSQLTRRAAQTFADRLTVKRIGLTYVISIGFESLNPDRAAEIANAIADAYLADQLEANSRAIQRAGAWLQDRLRELREQSSTAQRAVVDFKAKNNIVNTGTHGRLMGDQRVEEINSELTIARAQTSEARARLDRIQGILSLDTPNVTIDATVADSLKNDVISKLRSQYLDLANREAVWSTRYGRNHLAAEALRDQMREVRNSIVDELRRIAEGYKSDYQIAKQHEEDIQKELVQAVSQSQVTDAAQVVLNELESNAQTYRALYETLLQRYSESVQQKSFPITEARVVTPASPPAERSHPKALLILAGASLAGLMLGLQVAWLRDLWDRKFRTSAQIAASLHLNCLAILPHIGSRQGKIPWLGKRSRLGIESTAGNVADDREARRRSAAANGSIYPKRIVHYHEMLWYVVDSPLSRFAESVRAIKMAADVSAGVKPVIGITSALPNEGKSTIAASIALLMAHTDARTILVDCDLRHPSLTRTLSPAAKAGLIDIISGKSVLEDVVWTDPLTGLAFLPGLVTSHFTHTSEILASDAMRTLFDRLRESYHYIVVDLSPLAPVVDARATTRFIDAYVCVVEWGRTRFDAVAKALKESQCIYDKMLGAVLNKADITVIGRYEGYDFYSHKYYSGDGNTEPLACTQAVPGKAALPVCELSAFGLGEREKFV